MTTSLARSFLRCVSHSRAVALASGLALGAISLGGCRDEDDTGTQVGADAATEISDASSPPDSAAPRVTYVNDVQPILRASCADCHGATAPMPSPYPPFAESYAEIQKPSTRCPGDNIGTCVGLAVQNQIPEGTRCRTIVVRPFHREGWICLTEMERATIAAWVAGGMIER